VLKHAPEPAPEEHMIVGDDYPNVIRHVDSSPVASRHV
jgi:hypothetical protein